MTWGKFFAWAALAFLLAACESALDKPAALDPKVRKLAALEKRLPKASQQTPTLTPGPHWLDRPAPGEQIVFAGYRPKRGVLQFVLVLDVDPSADRLVLWPLPGNGTPIALWSEAAGREEIRKALAGWQRGEQPAGVIELPLGRTFTEKRLGPPLPTPGQVYAVAANYLSHLTNDLAVQESDIRRPLLSSARPRVFAKYPAVPPPGHPLSKSPFEPLGPFDDIRHPGNILIPSAQTGGSVEQVPAFFDYEVEIAVVIGRSLSWKEAAESSDAELQKAVVGYLLASDTKARNPQVMRRILTRDLPVPAANRYRVGDDVLDEVLGVWDSETCQWWSYAASWGEHLTLGPFLIIAAEDGSLQPRALLGARSYATPQLRGHPIPGKLGPDVFYLRQLVLAASERDLSEQMIWEIPSIIRSILDPAGNALDFLSKPVRLEPGDLILLGTPGGTVITSRPSWQLELLNYLFFWFDARKWHDLFFQQRRDDYLYPGDELFYWAEGLGYQKLKVIPASPALP